MMLPYVDAAFRTQLLLNQRDMGAIVHSLDALSISAFICNQSGKVIAMTAAGENLLSPGGFLTLRLGKLVANDRNRSTHLQEAIRLASVHPGDWPPVVRQTTLVLADMSGTLRRIDIAPISPGVMRLASNAASIVMVAEPRPVPNAIDMLRQAFGFTTAEAAVALDLAQGLSSIEIANRRQVSIATVRVQIHAVLQKAGVTKASAFAAMIGRLNL